MPAATTLEITTSQRQEMVDITARVQEVVERAGILSGLCIVFCPHTTAAIAINENADPDVRTDVLAAYRRAVPHDQGFRHREGNADAHTQSVLTGAHQTVIVEGGKLLLGYWQAIYFMELDGPRARKVQVKIVAG